MVKWWVRMTELLKKKELSNLGTFISLHIAASLQLNMFCKSHTSQRGSFFPTHVTFYSYPIRPRLVAHFRSRTGSECNRAQWKWKDFKSSFPVFQSFSGPHTGGLLGLRHIFMKPQPQKSCKEGMMKCKIYFKDYLSISFKCALLIIWFAGISFINVEALLSTTVALPQMFSEDKKTIQN